MDQELKGMLEDLAQALARRQEQPRLTVQIQCRDLRTGKLVPVPYDGETKAIRVVCVD